MRVHYLLQNCTIIFAFLNCRLLLQLFSQVNSTMPWLHIVSLLYSLDVGKDGLSISKILAIVVPTALVVVVILSLCYILLTRKAIKKENPGKKAISLCPLLTCHSWD